MSEPRIILKNATYLVTRRCSERRMFLRPDSWVAKVMLFCIGWAASFFSIQVHAISVLSNHYHMVLTDTKCRLPEFMGWLNRMTSLFVSHHRNRSGATWDASEKYSAVMLTTPEAVWKELAYVTTNAVRHRLVKHYDEWGGLLTLPKDILKKTGLKTVHPGRYLKKHAVKRLMIVKPPMLSHLSDSAYIKEYTRLVEEKQEEIRRAIPVDNKTKRRFMGMKRVMSISPFSKPTTKEMKTPRATNPVFAAVTPEGIKKAKAMVKRFREAYKLCWKQYKEGKRKMVFPYGTYKMRVVHGLACATRH